ncbi:MAG: SRPBCC family protein [Chloroflexota bacterium]|nr:SRPBCC family protein [Chloroflexota bacterium]
MDSADKLERTITLRVPIERVWSALTEAEHLSIWFGADAQIDLRPGGDALFGWEGGGNFPAVVETVDPPHCFSFRWRSSVSDHKEPIHTLPNTLVEFTLESVGEGTKLTLVESGFSTLSAETRDSIRSDNEKGWDQELEDLATYFNAQSAFIAM